MIFGDADGTRENFPFPREVERPAGQPGAVYGRRAMSDEPRLPDWMFGDDEGDDDSSAESEEERDLLFGTPTQPFSYDDEEDEDDGLPPLPFGDESAEQPKGLIGRIFAGYKLARQAEKEKSGFAGADLDPPTFRDKLRRRNADAAKAGSEDDPFARVLAPLSDTQLHVLKQEVALEEVRFSDMRRRYRAEVRRHTRALGLSIISLAAVALLYGHPYVDYLLNRAPRPEFLTQHLSHNAAGMLMFCFGMLVPLLAVSILNELFLQAQRLFFGREPAALVGMAVSGVFVLAVGGMLAFGEILAGGALVGLWLVGRGFVNFVNRLGGGS